MPKCNYCKRENDNYPKKTCSVCRAKRSAYAKKWNAKNKDKISAYQKLYKEKFYDSMTELEKKAFHREQNLKSKDYHEEYRKRPEVVARQKEYHKEYVKCEYGRQIKRAASQRSYWNKKNAKSSS